MRKIKDLTGQRFGRLTVLNCAGKNKHGHICWLCACDCGKTKVVTGSHLRSGDTISCGCYSTERAKKQLTKHGKKNTRIYNIWCSIKERCYNKNCRAYLLYGGRGITMFDEWQNDFQSFYNWSMANGYADNLTIDRIDSNGGYEPSNCRWATWQEQQNNRRNNHREEINGKILTLAEISKEYIINYGTLKSRIRRGWSIEDAIQDKDKRRRKRNND